MARTPNIVTNVGNAASAQRPQRATRIVTGIVGKETTGDRARDAVQTRAADATAAARSLPFGDGNLIRGVVHGALAGVTFNHLLGRQAVGCFPVLIKGSSACRWVVTGLGTATQQQISCFTDQIATVDWWVF